MNRLYLTGLKLNVDESVVVGLFLALAPVPPLDAQTTTKEHPASTNAN